MSKLVANIALKSRSIAPVSIQVGVCKLTRFSRWMTPTKFSIGVCQSTRWDSRFGNSFARHGDVRFFSLIYLFSGLSFASEAFTPQDESHRRSVVAFSLNWDKVCPHWIREPWPISHQITAVFYAPLSARKNLCSLQIKKKMHFTLHLYSALTLPRNRQGRHILIWFLSVNIWTDGGEHRCFK